MVVFVLESKGLYSQLLHFTKTTETESSSRPVDLITPVGLNLNFRGPPFDFWGGGGGGGWGKGDSRKKNILQTDFEGKKILQGNIWWKKILPWKKISFMAYNAGKNSYTLVCQEKKFYHQRFRKSKILTQTKSPLPPPPPSLKSHMVGPYS